MRKMTEKALGEAFAGESMAHMKYLMFQEIAEKAGFPNIGRLFKAISYEAEKIHAKLYKKAKKRAAQGEDLDIPEVYICPVCGYTHAGDPRNTCPVCGISSKKFKKF